ncbi:glycosyltransferase family protein [Marinitoga aeolica]|uniref:Glycosyl transferase family 1 n=1 Tax=Marinitoga aeolica TaxID=2809031 RepID=A0ABY8PU40_9BACT|nr:glycosyl transferase family 1 [Marinitoga aeolica]WGS66038.1 glycosyl transferase family 1 [Marinitoga aeolica]
MTILIIGYMHPKYDKRVLRTVKALSKENKVIYQYWTNNDETEYEESNVTYIPIKYTKNIQANPMIKLKNRRKLDKKIVNMIKNYDYDILYMHHFLASRPLEPFKIAKKRNKKIIYDIHEYHPENFLNNLSGIKKQIKEKALWKIFEKQLILSDKLVFVSTDMQKDVYQKLNIHNDYFIQKNYAEISVEKKEIIKEISFVGKINRNLDDEKEILKKLIQKGFKFKIIGMESEYFKDIPHEHTNFLPYEDMMKELSKSAFSLISFNTIKNREYKNDIFSLPNKYYDSIASETPVIVKNTFISMAKEVEKYNIGVVINPKKVEESVDKIIKAYENYDELLENIRKYKHEFIWTEKKEKEFVNFVLS